MQQEKIRKVLLAIFFASLCLPIAIQQTALGLLLAFLVYVFVTRQLPVASCQSPTSNPQPPTPGPFSFSTPLDRPLLFCIAALLISTLCSPDILNSFIGYRKLWLIGAFFVTYYLLKDADEAWRLVLLMVGVAAVVAAYGIVQHYTGIDWRRELLGKPASLDPFWFGRQEGFRTKGLHPSGITYAHNLLFPLTFVSVLLFAAGLSARIRLALIAGWGLMAFALLFSLTRGVWVAYAIVLLSLGVLKGGKTLIGVTVGGIMLGVFLFGAGPGVQYRFSSIFNPAENTGRGFIWQANIDMAKERPLLGWGYGNYKKFREPYYERYKPWAIPIAHAHNNFLQMWVETGLLGLSAFILLFEAILRTAWRTYRLAREPEKSLALAGFLVVIGFLVGGLTQYNFGDGEVVIVFWATAGLLMRMWQWVREGIHARVASTGNIELRAMQRIYSILSSPLLNKND